MSPLPTVVHSTRKLYPSDRSDVEWLEIKPKLPAPKGLSRGPTRSAQRHLLRAT